MMSPILFLLLLSSAFATFNGSSWFLSCPSTGVYTCLVTDSLVQISSGVYNISDCHYINCPIISLSGAKLFVKNVTFEYSILGVKGGALSFADKSEGVLVDVTFINCSATNGGAIYLTLQSNISLTNVEFVRNYADFGAGIYGDQGSQVICQNCNFTENESKDDGASMWLSTNCILSWIGGFVINQKAGNWASGLYLETGSNANLSSVSFQNLWSAAGTAIFLNHKCTANLYNIFAFNVTAGSQGGFAYMYDSDTINCYGCNFTQLNSGWIGGIAVSQQNSQLNFYHSTLSNIYSAAKGAIYILQSSTASLNQGTVMNQLTAGTSGSAISLVDGTGSTFICSDSIIRNGWAPDAGCIDVTSDNSASFDSCILDFCESDGDGGMSRLLGGSLTINGTTTISNSNASYGGAIYATSTTSIQLQGSFQIVNTSATTCGGVIYSQDQTQIDFQGLNWKIQASNTTPQGEFLCFQQSNMSLLQFSTLPPTTNPPSLLPVKGNIWIDDAAAAKAFLTSGLASHFPPKSLYGGASKLEWVQKPQISGLGLIPGELIPPFIVRITDRFNNTPFLSPFKIVIATATVNRNVTLQGEVTRSCLDFINGEITFSNLLIANATPGLYTITIVPLPGTLAYLTGDIFPSVVVTIAQCGPNQLFSNTLNGLCVSRKETSTTARVVFSCLGGVLLLTVGLCSGAIYYYRDFQIVKGCAPIFLVIMNCGVFLMSIALLSGVITGGSYCVVHAWFENLGFLLIFVPLILKTRRIQYIFQRKFPNAKRYKSKLENYYLLQNLVLTALAAVLALTLWTVLDMPRISDPIYYTSYVVLGVCANTNGGLVAICIRIMVLLYSVQLAFSVRSAPAAFNESKVISFAVYNWAIFVGIGSVLAQYAISDPEVSFIVSSIAIFVPSLVHTLSMTGYKAYECYTDPEGANINNQMYSMSGKTAATEGGSMGSHNSRSKGSKETKLSEPRKTDSHVEMLQLMNKNSKREDLSMDSPTKGNAENDPTPLSTPRGKIELPPLDRNPLSLENGSPLSTPKGTGAGDSPEKGRDLFNPFLYRTVTSSMDTSGSTVPGETQI